MPLFWKCFWRTTACILRACSLSSACRRQAGRQAGQLASIARLGSGKTWHNLRQASCKRSTGASHAVQSDCKPYPCCPPAQFRPTRPPMPHLLEAPSTHAAHVQPRRWLLQCCRQVQPQGGLSDNESRAPSLCGGKLLIYLRRREAGAGWGMSCRCEIMDGKRKYRKEKKQEKNNKKNDQGGRRRRGTGMRARGQGQAGQPPLPAPYHLPCPTCWMSWQW